MSAWIPGLGPTGITLHDVTGRGRNGTLTSTTLSTIWTISDGGYVLSFDGSDDYVNASIGDFTDPDVLSLFVRFKVGSNASVRKTIIGRENVASAMMFEIGQLTGIATLISGVFVAVANDVMVADTRYSMIYTRSGSGATHAFWLGGVQQSLSTNATNSYVNSSTLNIGRRAASSLLFDGQVAAVMFWDRVLTPDEIQVLSNDHLAPFRLKPITVAKAPAVVGTRNPLVMGSTNLLRGKL